MKGLTILFLAFLLNTALWAQSYNSGKPQLWNDLTGKKYNGQDLDLINFIIVQPEIICDSISQKCGVQWNTSHERTTPNCQSQCKTEQLEAYEMFFEIFDRKNNLILSKKYKWDINKPLDKVGGYVDPSARIVTFGDNLNLDYTTVNYWAQNLKWKKAIMKRTEDDGRKAFTIKNQLEKIKKQ